MMKPLLALLHCSIKDSAITGKGRQGGYEDMCKCQQSPHCPTNGGQTPTGGVGGV